MITDGITTPKMMANLLIEAGSTIIGTSGYGGGTVSFELFLAGLYNSSFLTAIKGTPPIYVMFDI